MTLKHTITNAVNQVTGRSFRLEEGRYGTRLIPTGKWSDVHRDLLGRNDIVELELNHAKGFRSNMAAPSFLAGQTRLIGLSIVFPFSDLTPINELVNLRDLCMTHCRSAHGLDFANLPQLTEVSLEWFSGADGLFELGGLRNLALFFYPGKDGSKPFSTFRTLEELRLSASGLQEIESFQVMEKIRRLEFLSMNHLTSLHGIEGLSNLHKLRVETCKKLTSIEPVAELTALEYLSISDCGDILSLGPIRKLRNLEFLHFFESTNIIDGDLSVIKELPKLKDVRFKKRRHYRM